MCKKLLCLVALLGIASVASAQTTTMIDDFESYWGQPAMVDPSAGGFGPGTWAPLGQPFSTASMLLNTDSTQYQRDQWTVDGGWMNPANPTDFELDNHMGTGLTFAPYDVTTNTEIHMSLRLPQGSKIGTDGMLIEWYGDAGGGQTWIPGMGWSGVKWWMSTDLVPIKIMDPAWGFDPFAGGNIDYSGVPDLVPGVWTDIVITSGNAVTWAANPLDIYDAMDGLSVQIWGTSGVSDTDGVAKLDTGGNPVYPQMPYSGEVDIDNLYFVEIPEPMTIGLLGLGGLALIRRKR